MSAAQTADECSYDNLSEANRGYLDLYDKGVYIDPECAAEHAPGDVVAHCNMFNLGQECRGCHNTCEGALAYREDFPDEYAQYVSAVVGFIITTVVGGGFMVSWLVQSFPPGRPKRGPKRRRALHIFFVDSYER